MDNPSSFPLAGQMTLASKDESAAFRTTFMVNEGEGSPVQDVELSKINNINNVFYQPNEFPVQSEDVGASVPCPEVLRASSAIKSRVEDGRTRSRFLQVIWCTVVVSLIILVISVSVSVVKNRYSGDPSRSNDSAESVAIAFDEITSYLLAKYNLSLFASMNDTNSPQYNAVMWLARDDLPRMKLPGSSDGQSPDDNDVYAYRFISRYVLVLLYYSLDGPTSWTAKTNFLTPGVDYCDWYEKLLLNGYVTIFGILCSDEGLPLVISLTRRNMTGSIPTEIGLLSTLRGIFVDSNNIEGYIPTELCNLSSLRTVNFGYNLLSGELPECIGSLKNLNHLFLNNNDLEGELPLSMQELSSLKTFWLDDNLFFGDPSQILQQLPMLSAVFLNANLFVGEIGSMFSLSFHQDLRYLDFSNNSFTSTSGFGNLLNMPSVELVDVCNNKLSGKLPSKVNVNQALKYLSLFGNSLTGSIPIDIQNLSSCIHLDLSTNKLSGDIPKEIGNLQNLTYLFLSNNPNFTEGSVPSTFENLIKLEELSMRNTNRNGDLPTQIGNMLDLVLLDLGNNRFTGTIPSSWMNLSSIEYLLLNGNTKIRGSVASLLGEMRRLRAVFIDGTNITDNLNELKDSVFELIAPGAEVIYADCAGTNPKVECNFCSCCDGTKDELGCSIPYLSNFDGFWETYFHRTYFKFDNKTEYLNSDSWQT